ncbi:FAD-binding oxidoreductase [Granulicella mallensis]|uniref:Glycine oxidase n=1 Tax=Granulicella mallensis TaxID=940614 RepID=A0A7W7ZQ63_9BACT|nr:FAD-dependent oxidoreductase [Granulicella mallensis]MBB5064134.1 glycine oxidase [Granulicella mallensis]
MNANSLPSPDILIAGAGIIGLSLALELHFRGAQVTVLERSTALQHASTAAAGMLAVDDPHNPPALLPLSQLSRSLYPAFLQRIESLSGLAVPFQTDTTIQYMPDGSTQRLVEHSLDPRQLAPALLEAVRATSIDLREHTELLSITETHQSLLRVESNGELSPAKLIHTQGAWARLQVRPVKGQMLRVQLPATLPLREVHRTEHIYIVPRTQGPQAGTALIGATLEDAGFDTALHPESLDHLRSLAAQLLPSLADEATAPQVEAWAGLRPATTDSLPILDAHTPCQFLAIGHFRNGILLAPATAAVMADLIEGKSPAIDLAPFAASRLVNR